MNARRTGTIAAVGAAFAALLAGAATPNRTIPPAPIVRQELIDRRGADLALEIERLHERLAPAAAPSTPGRNLFNFRAAPVRQPAPAPPARRAALTELAPAPAAALPPLKLAGIGEDAGAEGPVRIAFISGDGQLFMVKEQESVTPRYRVAKISADVVELLDVMDNSIRRLALR